jgi:glycosyltransferase involved in cell wall biosynthesis
MSHGRPLVYSAVNGLPETVRDGGISVTPKDPASIAAAANALLYDEDYREELGRNAVARSLEYKWSDLIPKIEDVFDKVLSGEYSKK